MSHPLPHILRAITLSGALIWAACANGAPPEPAGDDQATDSSAVRSAGPAGEPTRRDTLAPEGVIRRYFAAIAARRFQTAYRLWGDGGKASGMTYEEFEARFDSISVSGIVIGTPGRIEGAAGSRYVEIPVTIQADTPLGYSQMFKGSFTLRRSVVPGATPEERRWQLYAGEIDRRPRAPLRFAGACPFECCTYGGWRTTDSTSVYAQPDTTAETFVLPANSSVEATTGFVLLTRIGRAVARQSVELYGESGAPRTAAPGDTLLVLDYVGEGVHRVWYEGALYHASAATREQAGGETPPLELTRAPEQQWWARIGTQDGREGWLYMDEAPRMEGADACG